MLPPKKVVMCIAICEAKMALHLKELLITLALALAEIELRQNKITYAAYLVIDV